MSSESFCPFCNISVTNPTLAFNGSGPSSNSPDQDPNSTAHLILSTDHVLAFLDIMPLTRGHVLVAPRRHFEMLGDMDVQTSQEVRDWLQAHTPLLCF
jgi:diadenosine tetraphosphate (Ap4A) HIT family hydrolase